MPPSCGRTSMPPAQRAQKEAIGRSRGGLSTKIHIAVDATGHPLRMILTAGQVHEATQATHWLRPHAHQLIADKRFTRSLSRRARGSSVDVVIPPLASRTAEIAYDENAYGLRYLIECFINKIKHYRRSQRATRRPRETFCRCHPRRHYGLASRSCLNSTGPSVPLPTFASHCSTLECERRKQRDTSIV